MDVDPKDLKLAMLHNYKRFCSLGAIHRDRHRGNSW
jgi:hypothetical protein